MLLRAVLIFAGFLKFTFSDTHEFELYKKLEENYDPLERPVQNASNSVAVSLGLDLQQIVDLVSDDFAKNVFFAPKFHKLLE